jgi:hypothetical protein
VPGGCARDSGRDIDVWHHGLGQTDASGSVCEPLRSAIERITFASRLIKGGATLAWVHLEVLRGNEVLIAGRHLKFQPTGLPPGWGIITSPLLRPLLLKAIERAGSSGLEPSLWSLNPFGERRNVRPPIPLPAAGTLRTDALSMVETSGEVPDGDSTMTDHPLLLSDDSAAAAAKTFTVNLTRQHGNPGATLHGGCTTMLLDEVASASFRAGHGGSKSLPAVQRMQVNLLGALGVPGEGKPVKPVSVSATVSAAEARAHAVLRAAPGKRPAVEADIWW